MNLSKNNSDTPPAQASPQTTIVKRSRSAWSTVAFLFMLLLLMALGACAWLYMSWQDSQNQLNSQQSQTNNAQATIANLRQKLGEATGQAQAEANAPVNDEALIKTAVTNYNAALASPLKNPKIEVTKRDGNIAVASISDITAGYKAYLKKSNNSWIVIYSGQNEPPADTLTQFDLKL